MSESEEKALKGLKEVGAELQADITNFRDALTSGKEEKINHFRNLVNNRIGWLISHEVVLSKKERYDEQLIKNFYEEFQKFIAESQKVKQEQKEIDVAISALEQSKHIFTSFKPHEFDVMIQHIKKLESLSTMELKEDKDIVGTAKLMRKELKLIVKDKD